MGSVFSSSRNLGDQPIRECTVTLHRDCECMVQVEPMNDTEILSEKLVAYSKTGDRTDYLDGRLHMYYVHKSIHVWSVENVCMTTKWKSRPTWGLTICIHVYLQTMGL